LSANWIVNSLRSFLAFPLCANKLTFLSHMYCMLMVRILEDRNVYMNGKV
jgi:hypothetical protein